MPEPVLSNMWWPVAMTGTSEDAEKALCLWLNSALGLLLMFGHRQEIAGAWAKFNKPPLESMPVLNVEALDDAHLAELARTFDDIAEAALKPFPQLAEDPVRIAIDEAIASTLGLPDFSVLRELLSREPVVCLDLRRLLPER